jgi:hypothetical protein
MCNPGINHQSMATPLDNIRHLLVPTAFLVIRDPIELRTYTLCPYLLLFLFQIVRIRTLLQVRPLILHRVLMSSAILMYEQYYRISVFLQIWCSTKPHRYVVGLEGRVAPTVVRTDGQSQRVG